MQQFIHHRHQRLLRLLAALGELHAGLRAQHPDFERRGNAWLTEVTTGFDELGLQARAAVLSRLRTEFDLIARGIDPQRLTRIETFRRQFRTAAWSQVLAKAEMELHEALAPEAERLRVAEEQLGKLLLSGLQTGLLDETALRQAHDESAAETVWYRLAADARFELVCRQLLLEVIVADISLLLAKVARRIAPLLPQSLARPSLGSTIPTKQVAPVFSPKHGNVLAKTYDEPVAQTARTNEHVHALSHLNPA